MELLFSVNQYGSTGDVVDDGVFLHIDDTITLKFPNVAALEKFASDIQGMLPEIKEKIATL